MGGCAAAAGTVLMAPRGGESNLSPVSAANLFFLPFLGVDLARATAGGDETGRESSNLEPVACFFKGRMRRREKLIPGGCCS